MQQELQHIMMVYHSRRFEIAQELVKLRTELRDLQETRPPPLSLSLANTKYFEAGYRKSDHHGLPFRGPTNLSLRSAVSDGALKATKRNGMVVQRRTLGFVKLDPGTSQLMNYALGRQAQKLEAAVRLPPLGYEKIAYQLESAPLTLENVAAESWRYADSTDDEVPSSNLPGYDNSTSTYYYYSDTLSTSTKSSLKDKSDKSNGKKKSVSFAPNTKLISREDKSGPLKPKWHNAENSILPLLTTPYFAPVPRQDKPRDKPRGRDAEVKQEKTERKSWQAVVFDSQYGNIEGATQLPAMVGKFKMHSVKALPGHPHSQAVHDHTQDMKTDSTRKPEKKPSSDNIKIDSMKKLEKSENDIKTDPTKKQEKSNKVKTEFMRKWEKNPSRDTTHADVQAKVPHLIHTTRTLTHNTNTSLPKDQSNLKALEECLKVTRKTPEPSPIPTEALSDIATDISNSDLPESSPIVATAVSDNAADMSDSDLSDDEVAYAASWDSKKSKFDIVSDEPTEDWHKDHSAEGPRSKSDTEVELNRTTGHRNKPHGFIFRPDNKVKPKQEKKGAPKKALLNNLMFDEGEQGNKRTKNLNLDNKPVNNHGKVVFNVTVEGISTGKTVPGKLTPGKETPSDNPGKLTPGKVTPSDNPGKVTPGKVTPSDKVNTSIMPFARSYILL